MNPRTDDQPGHDLDFVRELERQSIDQIKKLRSHERYEAKIALTLHPGNASQAGAFSLEGYTKDISKGGCAAVFEGPVPVGDIFRVELDKNMVEVPVVFARCLRCRLVRDDAFEANFSFFSEIVLSELASGPDDSLI